MPWPQLQTPSALRKNPVCLLSAVDQGIFVHRRVFEEVGGYRDMPLMEDYQLVSFGSTSISYSIDRGSATPLRTSFWKEEGQTLYAGFCNTCSFLGEALVVEAGRT
jgi:hypothetical protein